MVIFIVFAPIYQDKSTLFYFLVSILLTLALSALHMQNLHQKKKKNRKKNTYSLEFQF